MAGFRNPGSVTNFSLPPGLPNRFPSFFDCFWPLGSLFPSTSRVNCCFLSLLLLHQHKHRYPACWPILATFVGESCLCQYNELADRWFYLKHVFPEKNEFLQGARSIYFKPSNCRLVVFQGVFAPKELPVGLSDTLPMQVKYNPPLQGQNVSFGWLEWWKDRWAMNME